MNEAINSLNHLYDLKDKTYQKFKSNEKDLNDMNSGKKNFKTMLGIKSKKAEIEKFSQNKYNVIFFIIIKLEKSMGELELLTKIATYNLEDYLNFFKVEKLAGYYQSLNSLADIQKNNSNKINDLWNCVSNDKNIQKILK